MTQFPVTLSKRQADKLLKRLLVKLHHKLLEIEECGSTTITLYLMYRNNDGTYNFHFILLGDVEVYRFNSKTKVWESLVPSDTVLRFNTSVTPGGIGHGWSSADGGISSDCNMHQHHITLNEDDYVLLASDGLGDVLDPGIRQ
jgi:hypothetical protein